MACWPLGAHSPSEMLEVRSSGSGLRNSGVVVSRQTYDRTVGSSEGLWFEARMVSSFLCCFLRQETLLHIVSLHPGV